MRQLNPIGSIAGLAVMLSPACAFAQNQEETLAAQSDDATENASGGLEAIVVTAQRRAQSYVDVPMSLTAIGGEGAQQSGLSSARDLTLVVPGLNFASLSVASQPAIRGVSSTSTAVGDESNVAVYVDGVYQTTVSGNTFDFNNIERIEVLKGPQGTLFGRNATGGAISIITRTPSFKPEFQAQISYARFNEVQFQAYATGGLTSTLAADLAVNYTRNDGYVDDLVRGGHIAELDNLSLRGKLLFTPSDTAKLTLGLNYSRLNDHLGGSGQPLNGNTTAPSFGTVIIPTKPRQSALSFIPKASPRIFGIDLTSEFDLGPVLLKSITAYRHDGYKARIDSDLTALKLQHLDPFNRPTSTFTQEIQLSSPDNEKLNWIVGAFYYRDVSKYNPLHVTTGRPPFTSFTEIDQFQRLKTDAIAGFGEVTAHILSNLELTAGLRYSYERKHFEGTQQITLATGAVVPPTVVDGTKSWDSITPRVVLRFEPKDDVSLYASYSRGFKSGQFNTAVFSTATVDPEVVEAYEVGIRAELNRRLRINAATYLYNYDDIQVGSRVDVNGVAGTLLQNAARARIKGFEAGIDWVPVRGLTFALGTAYTNARFTSFPQASVFTPLPGGGNQAIFADVTGNRLIRTPEWTFNASATYETDFAGGTLSANTTFFWSDNYYFNVSNTIQQPSYEILNARIAWTTGDDRYTFALFARNLTNQLRLAYAYEGATQTTAQWLPPRVFGGSIGFKFK